MSAHYPHGGSLRADVSVHDCDDCGEPILQGGGTRECDCGRVVNHRTCGRARCGCGAEPDYGAPTERERAEIEYRTLRAVTCNCSRCEYEPDPGLFYGEPESGEER